MGGNVVSKAMLRSFVDRIEGLNAAIEASQDDKKLVYDEAKSAGFDKAALKIVIKRRQQDEAAMKEQDELVDLYERALSGAIAHAGAPAREAEPVAAPAAEAAATEPSDDLDDLDRIFGPEATPQAEPKSEPFTSDAVAAAQSDDLLDIPGFLRRGKS